MLSPSSDVMVLEATTFCVEKRGAWLPTWDRASAEAADAAAAIPSHQGLADRPCPNSHPHATDALMFWSSTLRALTRTACISGPPSIVPSREPEAVLTGFPRRGTHRQSSHLRTSSPSRTPSSSTINVHTISSKKKQPAPSPTTARAQTTMLLLLGLPRKLPSSARFGRGLAGWWPTGTQCHTRGARLHHTIQCQSRASIHHRSSRSTSKSHLGYVIRSP